MEKCKYDLTDVDIFNKNIICENREQVEILFNELEKKNPSHNRCRIANMLSVWDENKVSTACFYLCSNGVAIIRIDDEIPKTGTIKFNDLSGLKTTEKGEIKMEEYNYDLTNADILGKKIICNKKEQVHLLFEELKRRIPSYEKHNDIYFLNVWDNYKDNAFYFLSNGIAHVGLVSANRKASEKDIVRFDDLQGLIKTEIDNCIYDLSGIKNEDLYDKYIHCDEKEHAIMLCNEFKKRDERFRGYKTEHMISWNDNNKKGVSYFVTKSKFEAGVMPTSPFDEKEVNFLDLPGLKKYEYSPELMSLPNELKRCEKYLKENSTCNELVKCSECIHFTELKSGDRKFDCDVMYGTVPISKDGFCSYGEKKEQITRFKNFSDEEVYILMAHIVDYAPCDGVLDNEDELLKSLVNELVMEYGKRKSKEDK